MCLMKITGIYVGRLLCLGMISAVSLAQQTPSRATQSTYRGKTLSFYMSEAPVAPERADALRAIGCFGTDGLPALSELVTGLSDPDPEVRGAAAWAIGQIHPKHQPFVAQALAKVLSDPSSRVRSQAAVALRDLGPNAAVALPALIAALRDPDATVRAPAADALGAIGPAASSAVGPLAEALMVDGEQVFVLRSIAYALGDIGPGAHAALPALDHVRKMTRVSYAAEEAILKINGLPVATYY